MQNQLAKIHNSSLDTSHSARNLGFIFDEHLTFADQITALSEACYYHIRQLRCIQPYPDSSTACTIATSIIQSKLDYCNSLYNKLPKSQLPVSNRSRTLLLILSLKFPSPVILPPYYSLHWLRITESIEYMLLSLTHKVLTTTQPPVHTCLHFQFTHSFIQHFFLLIHHYTHPQIPLFHSRLKTYLFHKSCPP